MKCKNCGNEIVEGYKFCSACGNPVVTDDNNQDAITMNMFSNNNNYDRVDTVNDINNNADINNDFSQNNGSVQPFVGPGISSINENNINNQNMMNNGINNVTNNNKVNPRKKKSILPIIIIILVVIVLGVLSILGYFYFFNKKQSPKNIFIEGLNNLSKSNLLEDKNAAYSENINFKIDSSDESFNEISKIVNNLDLVIDYSKNDNAKAIDSLIKVNYKNSNAFNIGGHLRNNDLYLSMDGIYDKYISVPNEEDIYENVFNTDYKLLRKSIINALEKSLKDEYFKKEKEIIVVNEKSKKVDANKLVINSSNLNSILTDFINVLSSDDEFISYLSKLFDTNKEDVKSELKSILHDINVDGNYQIEFSIYTSGIKCNFEGIKVDVKDTESYSFSLLRLDNENYDLNVNYNGLSVNGKLKYVNSNNTEKINLTLNLGSTNVSVNLDLKKLDNVTIKSISKENSVSYDEISDNESDSIINNTQNNKAFTELINDISNLFEVYDINLFDSYNM